MSSIFDFFKKNRSSLPRIISHLSFGFLVLFIGLNHNFSVEKDFNLKLGEVKKIDDYKFALLDLKLYQKTNYKAVVGKLQISNLATNEIRNLKPENL